MSSGQFSLASLIEEQDKKRQSLIQEIGQVNGTKIINYCSNFAHPAANIIRQDIIPLNDMLSVLDFPKRLDFIIHSPGGIVEVAEKIVAIIRDHVENFRVIVPEAAKSAATLIALASDEIQMSPIAELGPIDPAIVIGVDPATRLPVLRPAWSYLNSLKRLEEELKGGRDPNIVIPLVHKIDPTLLDVAGNTLQYSKSLAKKWLHEYMQIDQAKASEIADFLSDISKHLTHGRAIRLTEAKKMGIKAKEIPKNIWNRIYELHIRSLTALRQKRVKLLECESKTLFAEV